jgi:hypothetical protein
MTILRRCGFLQKSKIHPSLLDPTLYAPPGTMPAVVGTLRDAASAGAIPHAPSMSALSKALARHGPEVRAGVEASFKAVKKARARGDDEADCGARLTSERGGGNATQVLGKPHEDLETLMTLHQLLRDLHVTLAEQGQVLLICQDDLQRMALDVLPFQARRLSSTAQPRMAPSESYPTGCSLVFSTVLILPVGARSNTERQRGLRRPLQRFGPDGQLPLSERSLLAAGTAASLRLQHRDEATGRTVTPVLISDRVGHPFVVIKLHVKDLNTNKHAPWAQRSTPLQHGRDLAQVLQSVLDEAPAESERRTDLHRRVLAAGGGDKRLAPWVVITSDGGSDETMRRMHTLLVLAALMQHFDLDGLEKVLYCPYHSKTNPDERLNSTVKRQLSGNTISAGDRSKRAMLRAREIAAELLRGKTHGGEPLGVLLAPLEPPEDGLRVSEADCDMETIDDFVNERSEHVKLDFRVTDLPATVRARWQQAADGVDENVESVDLANFHHLEQLVQFLRRHVVCYSLYNVVIEKCDAARPAEACDWCRAHPRRGTFSFRRLRADSRCPGDQQRCAEGDLCRHAIFRRISDIYHQLEMKTPANLRPTPKCSVCRQTGHNRRTCPQRPQPEN